MPAFHPSSLPDLTGKVYLVTGGNAGIGRETVLHLARAGATVYMGCRSTAKGSAAREALLAVAPQATIHLLALDHMDLASVAAAAAELRQREPFLHGLVNNAGIMAVPAQTSADGWEAQWQTNYLAHWLLTYLLLPTLHAASAATPAAPARVVNVSSVGHKFFAPAPGIDYADIHQDRGTPWTRYGQSKLANVLHAKQLHALYGPGTVSSSESQAPLWAFALHPGNIYTDLNRNARFLGLGKRGAAVVAAALNCVGAYIPADQGAYTSVFCAAGAGVDAGMAGGYFVPLGKRERPSKQAEDPEAARRLWEWTEGVLREKGLLETEGSLLLGSPVKGERGQDVE